ncbi:hypothetical protein EYF80_053689 [Liparis tanakae]|uniref:Uncharacterized protein n=1 Tax=Liparis tanakae TaxID=230148 RepID=A0A4Z2F4R9_9TELE|nr:hypothetical protein EYF80_053689 [Liparis tanakae]
MRKSSLDGHCVGERSREARTGSGGVFGTPYRRTGLSVSDDALIISSLEPVSAHSDKISAVHLPPRSVIVAGLTETFPLTPPLLYLPLLYLPLLYLPLLYLPLLYLPRRVPSRPWRVCQPLLSLAVRLPAFP